MGVRQAIERYLRTGDHDVLHRAWPGDHLLERAKLGDGELRRALVEEVNRRARGVETAEALRDVDTEALLHRKVEPMVRGLFPRREQDLVLPVLLRSVLFLTPQNIESVLLGCAWPRTAWDLANLYLGSLGAQLLSDEALEIVGLSEETCCFVSSRYFDEQDPFTDFVVHEVAHVFHNCKRGSVGLHQTRRREWLLDIDYARRETFAYACEAYSWIVEHARGKADRLRLAEEYQDTYIVPDKRVDQSESGAIVREAAEGRNGWKVILARCTPKRSPRRSRGTGVGGS
jgi:hypothetical protein